jgi:hypothetical protein
MSTFLRMHIMVGSYAAPSPLDVDDANMLG